MATKTSKIIIGQGGEITRNSSTGELEYSSDGVVSSISLSGSKGYLGEIRSSLLTEPQFQAIAGTNWVLMDGRSVAGSDLATLTGFTNIPDGRGEFLRGLDNGRGVDPARAMASAQGDSTAMPNNAFGTTVDGNHSHTVWRYKTLTGGILAYTANNDDGTEYTYQSGAAGNHAHTITGGDSETRPRNVAVNYFIKIND
jgi:hypothetical protein